MEPPSPKFDQNGLVPCVIQDWRSGEVLTLAYMNEEALQLSQSTGELHLYSRSRDELWRKGATSGHTQAVKALRYDCDADAVLALVEPAGPASSPPPPGAARRGRPAAPACHTGERPCFHNGQLEAMPYEALPGLERTLTQRARDLPDPSYTATLLKDPPRIGEKVQEEAEEV